MTYLIIALVIVFIVAPIFSVLPSARQREQMKMRTEARHAGVIVELTSIDDPNPKQDKYVSHLGKQLETVVKVAAWRKPRQRHRDWRDLPRVNWRISRIINQDGGKDWQWDEQPPAAMHPDFKKWIESAVEELPEDVEQVEEETYMLSVYWHERLLGSEAEVIEFIADCVEQPLLTTVDDVDE